MKHRECDNQRSRLTAVSTGWQNELLPSGPMALILTTPTKAGEPGPWNTPKSILVTSIHLRFMDKRGSGAHRSPRPIPQYIACDVGQSVSSEAQHLSGEWLLSEYSGEAEQLDSGHVLREPQCQHVKCLLNQIRSNFGWCAVSREDHGFPHPNPTPSH